MGGSRSHEAKNLGVNEEVEKERWAALKKLVCSRKKVVAGKGHQVQGGSPCVELFITDSQKRSKRCTSENPWGTE